MSRMSGRIAEVALALLLLPALPLQGQDSVIVIDPEAPPVDTLMRGGPPPGIVTELIAFYNNAATTRTSGDVSLPSGSSFEGRLAVHRGTLRIAGRVTGPIAVVNGTLQLQSGAQLHGDILVVGGRLIREPDVVHIGRQEVFWDAAPVVRTPEGLLVLRERRRPLRDLASARTTFQTGRVRTTLLLATAGTYNRVEGLPIVFGPTFELRPTPTSAVKLDLRGILRTAPEGSGTSDFGFQGRLEYRTGPFGIAGRLYSEVTPIEDHPLSEGEAGWSAFLLQRDYRDYFDRRGGGGAVWVQPTRALRVELSLGRDHERSVRDTDPWSLFRNSDQWRRHPLVDDGHFVTAGLQLDYDTRNERDFPSTGWLIRARYEHSSSNDVAPVQLPGTVRPALPLEDYAYDRLLLDVRRYSRLTPELRVNARLRAEGWIAGDRLPLQRRTSLGGPDILPGYDFRAFNCAPIGFMDRALPALCDRVISAQVEVRTRLGLNLGYRLRDREGSPGRFIGIEEADLVFLTDAGKGWLAGEGPEQVPTDRIPSFDEWKVDFGVGIDAGAIGAYLAKGISEGGPVEFVVRLQRRF
jgi:hypothetical protein